MNSITGKEILALARGGDYAHPGETVAVDLVLAPIPKRRDRLVLDVGCGRGGTADYVALGGWGTVAGEDWLAYASGWYHELAYAAVNGTPGGATVYPRAR